MPLFCLIFEMCLNTSFQYGHLSLSSGSGFNGCYASHIVLTKGTSIFPIPKNVSDKMAAPINCSLATMINVVSCIPKANESGPSIAVIQVVFANIIKMVLAMLTQYEHPCHNCFRCLCMALNLQ